MPFVFDKISTSNPSSVNLRFKSVAGFFVNPSIKTKSGRPL